MGYLCIGVVLVDGVAGRVRGAAGTAVDAVDAAHTGLAGPQGRRGARRGGLLISL